MYVYGDLDFGNVLIRKDGEPPHFERIGQRTIGSDDHAELAGSYVSYVDTRSSFLFSLSIVILN